MGLSPHALSMNRADATSDRLLRRTITAYFRAGEFRPQIIDSGMSADLGYVVYTGTQVVMKGVKKTIHGVTVFRRVGGEWMAVVDAGMPDTPEK